ncbi:putative zinc finger protein [Actinomycetospora succinea]|uniref:Putative zinc finger protein n=1 Tax=Actinomycetospora succinea TaxID=663603 RepID=A0A4R6VR74_9PSEU|nr:zf-HC2 domain-containing protein [Actinomycetospora succinea]TDQ65057.1 putative zinc finger protein [Actinomycetospora succinea]
MTTTPDGPAHERLRELLGAHAIGRLDGAERAEVEAHLAGCPPCRAELAALAPLAGPLGRVDPDADHDADHTPAAASPDGFAAVLGRLEREREHDELAPRRPRAVRPLVAAAAAAVIGLAGVGVGLAVAGAGEPPVAPVAVQALDPTVRASAGTIDHTWGVEVVLTASGFAEGQRYEVTVLDRGGRPVPAGEFRGTGAAEMVCRLNSSVLLDQAGGFVVTDADGSEVLRSRFA